MMLLSSHGPWSLPLQSEQNKISRSIPMSQFYSIVHEEKFYKIRYPTSEGRHKQTVPPALKNQQQIIKSKLYADNLQKITCEFPGSNMDALQEASKSETFIHPPSRLSLSRLEKEGIALKRANLKKVEVATNIHEQRIEAELSQNCDKSLQQLMGAKPNNYKTQYSKITRRKETVIKRNLAIEEGQKAQAKASQQQTSELCEENLIERYRQLMQESKPLNFINRLYQHDILLTKLMPLSTKEKLIVTKINTNQNQIEDKISKIVCKPSQYDTIRKMLLNIHEHPEDPASPQQPLHPTYPYQTKDVLTKNQSQLIQYRSNASKFTSVDMAERRAEQLKRSMALQLARSKHQRNNRDEAQSLPKKLESQPHINPNAEKETFPPPKRLTCAAYIIYQMTPNRQKGKINIELHRKREYQNNLHAGSNIKVASEIASLTKIMTCVVVIEVCERYAINPQSQKYKTGNFECFVRGTTAEVEPGQIYTIHQLLHGLMLPSGNDASLALARWAGNVLLLNDLENSKRSVKINTTKSEPYFWALENKFLRCQEEKLRAKRCYNRFIAEMNRRARLLGMQRTTYANSHGLCNNLNRSCCLDLAILCQYAMQNSYFRQIVSCKQFYALIDKEVIVSAESAPPRLMSTCKSASFDPEERNLDVDAEDRETEDRSECEEEGKEERVQLEKKEVRWTNTHKLLHQREEYVGIKTGVTTTAGPCLASCLRLKERNFIIIVLNSKRLSHRFTDTEILRQWLARKEKLQCISRRAQKPQVDSSSSEDSNQ